MLIETFLLPSKAKEIVLDTLKKEHAERRLVLETNKHDEGKKRKVENSIKEENILDSKVEKEKVLVLNELEKPVLTTKDNGENQTKETKPTCDEVKITFASKLTQPCKGSSDGQIIITEVSGGTKPYSYIMTNGGINKNGMLIMVGMSILMINIGSIIKIIIKKKN